MTDFKGKIRAKETVQMGKLLFYRYLAKSGSIIEKPEDIIRDPYVFEFLKIPESYETSEKELETRLIENLQSFLLELGKGFTFVGRQYSILVDNEYYKIDLVFYHRFIPCFEVAYELKTRILSITEISF